MSYEKMSYSVGIQGKSMVIAYLLWFFLGGLGVHRFYLGRPGSGVTQLALLTIGIVTSFLFIGFIFLIVLGIWWLLDAYLIMGIVDEYNQSHTSNLSEALFSIQGQSQTSDIRRQPPASDPIGELDKLERLHSLFEKGVLTEAEYGERKRAILGQGLDVKGQATQSTERASVLGYGWAEREIAGKYLMYRHQNDGKREVYVSGVVRAFDTFDDLEYYIAVKR